MIELIASKEELKDLIKGLELVDKGLATATMRALNKTIVSARAEAIRMLRKDYNMKAKDIRAGLWVKKASPRLLLASFGGEGSPGIPLIRFGVRAKAPSTRRTKAGGYTPKGGIKALVKREKGRLIVGGAFVAQMSSGHIGVFKRKSGMSGNWWQMRSGEKIGELYGPSPFKILASDKYEIPLEEHIEEIHEKNMLHQAKWLLKQAGLR